MTNEDVLRWLCTALLKTTDGDPVDLTDDELYEPFELTLKTIAGGLRVHIIAGDDDTPNSTTAELEIEVPPGSPVPVDLSDDWPPSRLAGP